MSSPLSAGDNLIDWPAIRMVLKQGTQVDVQLSEIEPPLPYVVLMALDMPVFICRLAGDESQPDFEPGESQMAYIPTARDLCSVRVVIKEWAEGGKYLALAPISNAEFLRRRRSIRLKTWENISYRVQFDGKSNIYKGIAIEDIGRGGIGMLVYAAGPISEGVQARVKINLPGVADPVSAVGVVSHCVAQERLPRMFRIGIKFTSISPRDKQAIAMYIDQSGKSAKPKSNK